jgi:hypothetical protein
MVVISGRIERVERVVNEGVNEGVNEVVNEGAKAGTAKDRAVATTCKKITIIAQ